MTISILAMLSKMKLVFTVVAMPFVARALITNGNVNAEKLG
jgi:hypothetical protein